MVRRSAWCATGRITRVSEIGAIRRQRLAGVTEIAQAEVGWGTPVVR